MRFWKFGVAAAACAACCAPLVTPLFVGTAFVGAGAAGVGYFESVELGVIALVLGLGGLWLSRRAKKRAAAACNCATDAGCNVGTSCDLPAAKQTS